MRAGEWLRHAERDLPLVSDPAAVVGVGPVLILAPHPDDESLGCGALIAALAAAGRPPRIAVVSDGAMSHPNSRTYPRSRLVALRQEETRSAVAALGLDPARDLLFLGLPDAGVPNAGPAFDRALASLLALPRPGAILAAWQHDPHRDHIATWALAAALARATPGARLLAYPVWGLAYAHPIPGFPLPPEPELASPPCGTRFDTAPWLATKEAAVTSHASQLGRVITDDPDGFALPEAALALAFRPFELFLQETP